MVLEVHLRKISFPIELTNNTRDVNSGCGIYCIVAPEEEVFIFELSETIPY